MELPTDKTNYNPPPTMKTFTVNIDERLETTLDELRRQLGKTSRAEVFRMAIALLKIAGDAREKGLRITLADGDDRVQKEILIPQ